MLIDHVGLVFFPEIVAFRIVGRISFPLFAWLLAQGEIHTRNVWQYGLRLLILAGISQPLYQLALGGSNLNILFTLALGLVCLRGAKQFPEFNFMVCIGIGFLAQAIQVDYGFYGIVLIWLISRFRSTGIWWLSWILFHWIIALIQPALGLSQLPAALTPLIFLAANHQRGAKARWFYGFYPVHLLLIFAVRDWIL